MNNQNTRRGFTQEAVYKNSHSRGMLSGIYNACRYQIKGNFLINRYVEDPRLQAAGMTPYFTEKTLSKTYRLGLGPTGAASEAENIRCKAGELSGQALTYKEKSLNKGSFRAPLRSGFTLIELLVVVLIIGILAAVAVPQYQKAVVKSRMATILPLVKSLSDAMEIYYLSHGVYPTADINDLDIPLPSDCVPVEREGYLTFACGNDFVLDMTNGVSRANYCPNKNTTWNDCSVYRDFQIAFIGAYFSDDRKGKKLCTVMHNSDLGKRLCSSFPNFEYAEQK